MSRDRDDNVAADEDGTSGWTTTAELADHITRHGFTGPSQGVGAPDGEVDR